MNSRPMSNIDKRAQIELYAKVEQQAHKLRGNPIAYQVVTGMCPVNVIEMQAKKVQELLDELEAKDKLNAELMEKQRLIDICQGQGMEHRIAAEKRAEAAEKRIADSKAAQQTALIYTAEVENQLEDALARIAELEAREVTLPPVELVGYGDWPMFDANLVTKALRTAGINVAAAGKGE